ncbi:FecR/PupR family sigma factor regulator, partial [Bordetella petrii]|uniref:FecR/PupR family sigma factor regulator n=1 Tax=Bordetella petrii TaxID=94624 RepID=UPI001E5D6541
MHTGSSGAGAASTNSASALNGGPGRDKLPGHVIDTAISWSIKLERPDASAQARQAFASWLHASPQHGLAWQRIMALRIEGLGGGRVLQDEVDVPVHALD